MSYPKDDAPPAQRGKKLSWTTFSFEGQVTVFVHKLEGSTDGCTIRPKSLGLNCQPTADKTVVAITLSQPAKLSIEFADDAKLTNQLLVFADPLEQNVPPAGDPSVIHFAPGTHDIGKAYKIKSHTTVYVAGGAYVYGGFSSDQGASNIVIRGRGVISGERMRHPSQATDALALVNLCGNNHVVEGVTAVNAPTYNVQINAFWEDACGRQGAGRGATVRNVKAMSWFYTTDGVIAGRDALIEDSFFKVNDDALKIFQSNTLVQRCTVWQLDNGMPFMMSWITPTDESNITVKDSTVIHVEHDKDFGDGLRPSVFGAVHGAQGHLSGFTFQDIVIEGPVFRGFGIGIQPNPWAADPAGTISDVSFKNIVFDESCSRNVIEGDKKTGAKVSRVFFHDLEYGRTCVDHGGSLGKAGGKFAPFDPTTTDDVNNFACGKTHR